jgi:hypothetical protein
MFHRYIGRGEVGALWGGLIADLMKQLLKVLTYLGMHDQSGSRIDRAAKLIARVVREPHLTLTVLRHQRFQRHVNGERRGFLHGRNSSPALTAACTSGLDNNLVLGVLMP